MGSENLFFKRKQGRKSLDRKSKKREPYETVLIKCEGKTEFYYLKGLCEELKLNKVNIHITRCERGTDPMSIVDEAIEEYYIDKEYDRVYCLFDKEQHTYPSALDKVQTHSNNNVPIYAIPSIPCIEYQFLLHFSETTKQYKQKGKKSSGDQVKSELKKYITDYHVGDKDIFKKTKEHLSTALVRGKRIDKLQQKNGTDDPSTKIYELIEYLNSLKR